MKFCLNCGEALPEGAAFCGSCGRGTGSAAAPARATHNATSTLDLEQRWNAFLQAEVLKGARIEMQQGHVARLVYGKPVNHVLHLLLGLLTCSLWWFVWLALVLAAGEHRTIVAMDDAGNISSGKA